MLTNSLFVISVCVASVLSDGSPELPLASVPSDGSNQTGSIGGSIAIAPVAPMDQVDPSFPSPPSFPGLSLHANDTDQSPINANTPQSPLQPDVQVAPLAPSNTFLPIPVPPLSPFSEPQSNTSTDFVDTEPILHFNISLPSQESIGSNDSISEIDALKPYGPYYCQARCMASCIETSLAQSLDECMKFCPSFQDNFPCAPSDIACWLTCGLSESSSEPTGLDSTIFTVTMEDDNSEQEQDPFIISLTWSPIPNATLYIVEFYPVDWQPPSGEKQYFRAMTTSLSYTVRKEDECVEYDARLIGVNSNGLSVPAYTHIDPPVPVMISDHFHIRHMHRDAQSSDTITVAIDYTLPAGWPVNDVDIDAIRVTATDCRGPLGARTFGTAAATPNVALNPAYNAVIGKTPVAAILVSFSDDVLQSDCLFHMKVSILSSRCNTSSNYDDMPVLAPGVDFRINCGTVPGACGSNVSSTPPSPIAVPGIAVPAGIQPPGFLPAGLSQPQTLPPTIGGDNIQGGIPTPPAFPNIINANQPSPPMVQPLPPSSNFNIMNMNENGSMVQATPVFTESQIPPMCELAWIDIMDPTIRLESPSFIDFKLMWLEHQPLVPAPAPSYFIIRYGPIFRLLVDNGQQWQDIMPGTENVVRSAELEALRYINITHLERNSVIKVQVCAVFNQNSEQLIQWPTIPSYRIDLAALEPIVDLDQGGNVPLTTVDPNMLPPPPLQPFGETADIPLYIQLGINSSMDRTMYWALIMAAVSLTLLTAIMMFFCLKAICDTRHRVVVKKFEKPMVIVQQSPPPPTVTEVVKVPMA